MSMLLMPLMTLMTLVTLVTLVPLNNTDHTGGEAKNSHGIDGNDGSETTSLSGSRPTHPTQERFQLIASQHSGDIPGRRDSCSCSRAHWCCTSLTSSSCCICFVWCDHSTSRTSLRIVLPLSAPLSAEDYPVIRCH